MPDSVLEIQILGPEESGKREKRKLRSAPARIGLVHQGYDYDYDTAAVVYKRASSWTVEHVSNRS